MPSTLDDAMNPSHTVLPEAEFRKRKPVVLLLDYFFPPMSGSGVQRTLGYVRHLEEWGWTPAVLTVRSGDHFSYDTSLLKWIPDTVAVHRTSSFEPARFARLLLATLTRRSRINGSLHQDDGRPVWMGPHWVKKIERSILFPDRHIGWLPSAVSRGIAIHRRTPIDVLYSTSTFVTRHLIAYILKRLLRIPWVADFQDPWVQDLATPLHQQLGRALEHLILTTADRATFTTERLRSLFLSCHPIVPEQKLVAIPMGFHPDAFEGLTPQRRPKFTITHFGGFYAPRSPRPFLEALGKFLKSHPGAHQSFEVLFFGNFDAEMLDVTERLIREQDLAEIVHLAGIIPYHQGLTLLMNSDVLLVVTAPGTSGRTQVPSKLYEYLATGKPILALAPEGPSAQLVREANAGVVADLSDVQGIAEALRGLHDRWREGRLVFDIKEGVRARFTWKELTRQFASVLNDVITHREAIGRTASSRPHRLHDDQ